MPKTTYVDNTNATNPPGGKRHIVDPDVGTKMPTDQIAPRGRKTSTRKSSSTATARKAAPRKSATARKAASPARKTAAKKAPARKPARKTTAKKAARSRR